MLQTLMTQITRLILLFLPLPGPLMATIPATTIQFHQDHAKDLAVAACLAYERGTKGLPADWQQLQCRKKSGLYVKVFELPAVNATSLPRILVAIRGTADHRNLLVNLNFQANLGKWLAHGVHQLIPKFSALLMERIEQIPIPGFVAEEALQFFLGENPDKQIKDLIHFVANLQKRYAGSHQILVTGHSLGGALSSLVALVLKIPGIGFANFSISHYTYRGPHAQYDQNQNPIPLRAYAKNLAHQLHFYEWSMQGDKIPLLNHRSAHTSKLLHPISELEGVTAFPFPACGDDGKAYDLAPWKRIKACLRTASYWHLLKAAKGLITDLSQTVIAAHSIVRLRDYFIGLAKEEAWQVALTDRI